MEQQLVFSAIKPASGGGRVRVCSVQLQLNGRDHQPQSSRHLPRESRPTAIKSIVVVVERADPETNRWTSELCRAGSQ